MSARQVQLDSFSHAVMFQQDHDLIQYLRDHGYSAVYGYGDVDYFRQFVAVQDHPADFGIYIMNDAFCYQELATHVNWVLSTQVRKGLYLALNKWLAAPVDQSNKEWADDYDTAIQQFMAQNLRARVKSYHANRDDKGQKFNFAHPLTRFYLDLC